MTSPIETPGGCEFRLSPAGWELAICAPDRDEAWCVDLETMCGRYRPLVAVSGWTRLVPAEGASDVHPR